MSLIKWLLIISQRQIEEDDDDDDKIGFVVQFLCPAGTSDVGSRTMFFL